MLRLFINAYCIVAYYSR